MSSSGQYVSPQVMASPNRPNDVEMDIEQDSSEEEAEEDAIKQQLQMGVLSDGNQPMSTVNGDSKSGSDKLEIPQLVMAESSILPPASVKDELQIMLKIASPVTLATVCRIAMWNINAAFLGHLGTDELAGASLALICIQFIFTFLISPGYALNSLGAQAIGSNNPHLLGNWLQLSLVSIFVIYLPALAIFLNIGSIVDLFSNDARVVHFASEYGRVAVAMPLLMAIYVAIRQYFQALQNVIPAAIVSTISVAINVLLNQTFVNGFGSDYKGIGFAGAPIAATLSVLIQLCLFYCYAIVYKRYHSVAWNGWTLDSFRCDRIRNFGKIVVPICIADASSNWARQILTLMCASLDSDNVAAIAICYNIWTIMWSIYWGIGLSTVVRVGRFIGKGDVDSAKLVAKVSFFSMLLICGFFATLLYVFRMDISLWYTKDEWVRKHVHEAIGIVALDFLCGGLSFCGMAVMEGLSQNTTRGIVYTGSAWFIFFPMATYLALYSDFNAPPVLLIWCATLTMDVFQMIVIWFLVWHNNWDVSVSEARKRSEAMLLYSQSSLNVGYKNIFKYGNIRHLANKNHTTIDKSNALLSDVDTDVDCERRTTFIIS